MDNLTSKVEQGWTGRKEKGIMWSIACELVRLMAKKPEEEYIKPKATDVMPVDIIKGRINDLKKILMDINEDEVDEIWNLRIKIETLTELLEMWAERRNDDTDKR